MRYISNKLAVLVVFLLPLTLYSASDGLIDLAGIPALKNAVEINGPGRQTAVSEKLRIAFYNIENFGDGETDGKTRTPKLAASQAELAAAIVDEIDPDILFISEIENTAAAKLLNESLANPFPQGWITSLANGGTPLNLAGFSRVKGAECSEIDFSTLMGPGKPPRGALRFRMDLDDKHTLLAYVVHLKSNYGSTAKNRMKRENAIRIMRSNADEMAASEPAREWEMIVLGDMNVDPTQNQFYYDESLKPLDDWTDLWTEQAETSKVTLPYRNASPFEYEAATFDRFIVSPSMTESPWTASDPEVVAKGVNTEDKTTNPGSAGHVSDHYPIYFDLVK